MLSVDELIMRGYAYLAEHPGGCPAMAADDLRRLLGEIEAARAGAAMAREGEREAGRLLTLCREMLVQAEGDLSRARQGARVLLSACEQIAGRFAGVPLAAAFHRELIDLAQQAVDQYRSIMEVRGDGSKDFGDAVDVDGGADPGAVVPAPVVPGGGGEPAAH